MKHSLRVCWLYHDIMDLYGDKGNMMVLKKRCEDRDIDFVLDTCGTVSYTHLTLPTTPYV